MNSGAAYPPQSLADIVGHRTTVARLRGRFRHEAGGCGRHDTPLLLYGLPGVGKTTVARMYAKALLCDSPRDDRSIPCSRCISCAAFDSPGSPNFDFCSIDAAQHRDASGVNSRLSIVPKGPRRVILVENFDRAAPEFVDALLKPMEAQRRVDIPTTFVLVARSLNDVRSAGQSRCEVERLEPLQDADTQILCTTMATANELRFADDTALETLVVGSRGLPKLIASVCSASHDANEVTACRVRRILDIDWGAPILRYWLSLLTGEPSASEPIYEGQLIPKEAAIYSRFVVSELLGAIRAGRLFCVGEPALCLADGELFRDLVHALGQKAKSMQLPPEWLLAKAGEVIGRDDFTDEFGVVECNRMLRALFS